MNVENMNRLADYLDALPADYEHFDMRMYRSYYGIECTFPSPYPLGCGAVACAIGHAPLALPDVPLGAGETWLDYTNRVLIDDSDERYWCFDYFWAAIDNTPGGAAARIRWLIAHGLPDDWRRQMLGYAPLCYREIAS